MLLSKASKMLDSPSVILFGISENAVYDSPDFKGLSGRGALDWGFAIKVNACNGNNSLI